MLSVFDTFLLVIDVQEKLLPRMQQKETLTRNLQTIIQGARVFSLPVIYTEQAPNKIGTTIPELAPLLKGCDRFEKLSFSCYGLPDFVMKVTALKKKNVIVAGVETHVCVYQTVLDLIKMGFNVHVVVDAVSSRTPLNKEIGLNLMSRAGANLTSTETVLCELLKRAEGKEFKEIFDLIK